VVALVASTGCTHPASSHPVEPAGPLEPTGPATKVCQVLGEVDRERGQPTVNRTESRFGISGADLGIPIEHQGALHLYFGDTFPTAPLLSETGYFGDSMAVTTDTDPDDCLSLDFATRRPGVFAAASIPGVDLGAFDVPTGGFSDGQDVYVFYSTDRMKGSILARSPDGGPGFSPVYPVSSSRFVNVAAQVVDDAAVPGLPDSTGKGVVMIGSGTYRKSDPYLAWMPLDQVSDRTSWRYFAGLGADGRPAWSASEDDAQPLFHQPCIGELSVDLVPELGRWVLLYNCDQPAGIEMRTATVPWDWSADSTTLADDGPCHFVHQPADPPCDAVSDPGREQQRGGVYGPYLIPRFTRPRDDGADVYFAMSTWNPYAVVLMRVTLARATTAGP
jgi:hypothetical protein